MRALTAGIAAAVAAALAGAAAAAPRGHVAADLPGRAEVDWTRGMLTAQGAAAADLRAPNPSVARIRAERIARERAREALAARARELSGPNAGTVGNGLDGAATARLSAAVDRAVELDVGYGSDGSTAVTLGLPVEAVRQALSGADAPVPVAERNEAPVTAVVIEAGRALRDPVVGIGLRVGDERYAGPTVYHRAVKSALADPRAGDNVVRARALSRDGADLVLAKGDVTAWQQSRPLVIIVAGRGGRR